MCGSALEADTMPRSFLVKKNNYSHCPLKKRPLTYFLQESEEQEAAAQLPEVLMCEEPENLSLKPEDRYAAAEKERKRLRQLMQEAPLVASSPSPPPAHQPLKSWTPPSTYYGTTPSTELKLSSPLEPLNLNVSSVASSNVSVGYHHHHHHHHQAAYQTPYLPFAYQPYRPVYRHEQLSPFAPCESPPTSSYHPESAGTHKLSDGSDIEDLSSSSSGCGGSLSPDSAVISVSKAGKKSGNVAGNVATPRYQCPDCHKSYSTYCGLTKHQELHCVQQQVKKSFSCKHCDKVYVSLGALKMHIRTHTLPCKCMLCGKAFSRPWLLQGHIRTHTGEKPFSCPHCSRSFADRSNLRAHLQTHSDVKRYSCKACGKTFSRMSLLTKHEDSGCPGAMTTALVKRD